MVDGVATVVVVSSGDSVAGASLVETSVDGVSVIASLESLPLQAVTKRADMMMIVKRRMHEKYTSHS